MVLVLSKLNSVKINSGFYLALHSTELERIERLTLIWRNAVTLVGGDVVGFECTVDWIILQCSNL